MGKEDIKPQTDTPPTEPRGFGQRTRGLAGEYAHEQGWGLDVEERTKQPEGPQDTFGGTDYEYGPRDFGDDPVNTEIDRQDPTQVPSQQISQNKEQS